MFERNQFNLHKAPGQEEYEYEIDAEFQPEQDVNANNLGSLQPSEEMKQTHTNAFSHVLVQSDERSPSLSPSNKDDKSKISKQFQPYSQLSDAQRKSRKTNKLGEDLHLNFFGGGSTGDTGGLENDPKQLQREEEKSASMIKNKTKSKSKNKNKVTAKESEKEFQILMQSKKQTK